VNALVSERESVCVQGEGGERERERATSTIMHADNVQRLFNDLVASFEPNRQPPGNVCGA